MLIILCAFTNSCSRNCDHYVLFIITGNDYKESCYKLFLILMREQGLCIIKSNCSGKMVIAFTIEEKTI